MILWGTGQIGHYTLIFWRGATLHYFDPLGLHPSQLGRIVDQDPGDLMNLLPTNTHYNHQQFQKVRKSVQTCGRFCVLRFNFKRFDDKEFLALMYLPNLSPDDIAVLMTLDTDLSHWKSRG